MTQRDTSGPAFPHVKPQPQNFVSYHPGMSLRDWYAGQALPSILLRCWDDLQQAGEKTAVAAWASLAYAVADAMLAARSPALEAPQPDPRDELLRELRSAAATVLDGLNERIQEAPDHAVPVFDGITELTEALVKIQEALGDD